MPVSSRLLHVAFATGFMLALVAALLPPAIAAHTSFRDVEPGHAHERGIHWITEARYMQGFEDGTFRPNNSITRGQAATVLQAVSGVSYVMSPVCGSQDMRLSEARGKGSTAATVSYTVDGGDHHRLPEIPAEGSVTFTPHSPGLVTLYVDDVQQAVAQTHESCGRDQGQLP